MESAPTDYSGYQEKGLSLITEGRNLYSNSTNNSEKEKGFEIFREGLEILFIYLKNLKNDDTKPYIKENIKNLLEEAEKMKAELGKAFADKKPSGKSPKSSMLGGDDAAEINQEKQSETKTVVEKIGKKDEAKSAFPDNMMDFEPSVQWGDLVGLEKVKQYLLESILLPLKFPQIFAGHRRPHRGILLYGVKYIPPGSGKKTFIKACAKEGGLSFFGTSATELCSQWEGEQEGKVKRLFEMARANQPSIIFIDEIDHLNYYYETSESEAIRRVKTEIIVQIHEIQRLESVYVVMATNCPWSMDLAIRKRLSLRLYFPLPDRKEREELIKSMIKGMDATLNDQETKELVERTESFSRSELSSLVKDASMEMIRKLQKASYFKQVGTNSQGEPQYAPCDPDVDGSLKLSLNDLKADQLQLKPTSMDDFLNILKTTKPSTALSEIKKHEQWKEDFGTMY